MRKALVVVLAFSLSGFAQEKRPGEVVTTIEVEIVTLDVLALDKKGKPVYDLKPEELEVKIGGRVQPLEGFDPPTPPEGQEIAAPSKDAPSSPGRPPVANPLHLVLFFDFEDLPVDGLVAAVEAAKEWARTPAGAPGISVVTYLGAAGALVWDETSSERVENVLDSLLEESRTNRVDQSSAEYTSGMGRSRPGSRPATRNWEARRREEARLVQLIADSRSGTSVGALVQNAYDDFSEYLRSERERVVDLVHGIGEVATRLSLLKGRRHLLLLTQGIERVPGRNLVEFLKRALARGNSRAPSITGPEPRTPAEFHDLNARYRFDASPLRELRELEESLVSLGVVTHFIAPSSGIGMPTAEQSPIESFRDGIGDAHSMRDGVEPVVQSTGGQSRGYGVGQLANLFDVASATYRVAVRMTGVQTGRSYKVQVASKRPGVTVTSRSAYQPKPPASQAPLLAEAARSAGAEARREERRPGVARKGAKSMPVTLRWKGKTGTADGGKKRYVLEVAIPTDAIRFVPESDAMVASLKIGIQARDLDKNIPAESSTEDAFLALTGEEYKEASGKDTVRKVTLLLTPGKWELAITVSDELENAFGSATERVTAEE